MAKKDETTKPEVALKDIAEEKAETPAQKAEKKEGDTVEVPKSLLQKLMDKVERLEAREEILTEASDKKRMYLIEQRRRSGQIVKSVKISTIDGKPVLMWKTTKNEAYFDSQGQYHEDQVLTLTLANEDDTTEVQEIAYVDFFRRRKMIEAEVVEERRTKEGSILWGVQTTDGRELEMGLDYFN